MGTRKKSSELDKTVPIQILKTDLQMYPDACRLIKSSGHGKSKTIIELVAYALSTLNLTPDENGNIHFVNTLARYVNVQPNKPASILVPPSVKESPSSPSPESENNDLTLEEIDQMFNRATSLPL